MFCLRVLASFTTLIQKNERVLTKIRKKMSEFRIIKNRGLSFLTDRSRYIAHPIILLFESNQSRFLFATNTSPELPCLHPAV